MNWLLIFIGLITGFLVGLTGVGAGALISLVLLFMVGIPAHTAVGTALAFAAVTKIVATRVFYGYSLVDWTVVSIMWIGSISSSIASLIWMRNLANSGQDVSLIKQVIAGAILLAIMSLFLQPTIEYLGARRLAANRPGISTSQVVLTIIAGVMLGTMITLTSVGMGALGLIILTQLFPKRMSPPSLVATNVAHAVPLAFFGGVGHIFLDKVDFSVLLQLLLGSVPGAIFGALLAAALPHQTLRTVLSATLWIFGLQLWWAILPSS
ncbi:hypothetical protein TI04_04610 [Achromatium sp. WMS2]|nr:hypothetical protein TI04_04610 [Achromatium sp. WMS2]